MTTKTGISLASLDARSASDTPFRAEYISPDGKPSGVFLLILGAQSSTVIEATQKLLNGRRRQEAFASAQASRSGRNTPTFTPVEEDIEFGQTLTAIRLAGWEGITEPFSPELALRLVQSNSHIGDFITEVSADLSNFMKA